MIKKLSKLFSSSMLAITLVGLIILFSLVGVILPQEQRFDAQDMAVWQNDHPLITNIFEPVGFFHVFHSWPFLITIALLMINTLTCSVLRFLKNASLAAFRGEEGVEKAGSILFHLSLILFLTGAFYSASVKLDGFIVLTEGQSFTESHEGYLRLVEGPIRREVHKNFEVVLTGIQREYEKQRFPVSASSSLVFLSDKKKVAEGTVGFNKPFTYEGVVFTLHETGFSPRLVISENKTGRRLIDSFIALKTFRQESARVYRDFLPLNFLKQKVIVTLYPDHIKRNNEFIKNGEKLKEPLLVIEVEDESGKIIDTKYLASGDSVSLDEYSVAFTDVRHWAAFKVTEDPGYIIVCISLVLGIITLILRYVPELWHWLKPETSAGT